MNSLIVTFLRRINRPSILEKLKSGNQNIQDYSIDSSYIDFHLNLAICIYY